MSGVVHRAWHPSSSCGHISCSSGACCCLCVDAMCPPVLLRPLLLLLPHPPAAACVWMCMPLAPLCCMLQVKACADAGANIVRITVQGRKEAEACMKIREQLFKDG